MPVTKKGTLGYTIMFWGKAVYFFCIVAYFFIPFLHNKFFHFAGKSKNRIYKLCCIFISDNR
jgi:hypothetical protein